MNRQTLTEQGRVVDLRTETNSKNKSNQNTRTHCQKNESQNRNV